MESRYDRVDVPQNLYLNSEAETEEFGTGVYPVSVISRKSNYRDDKIKIACFNLRRKRLYLYLILGVILLLVFILCIIVATKKEDETEGKLSDVQCSLKADFKEKGLIFVPNVDNIPFIKFSVGDMKTYHKYTENLQFQLFDYQSIHQQRPEYVDCVKGPAPEGKACTLTDSHFGAHCSHLNMFGYSQGRPCVLLILNLDNDATIVPFTGADKEIVNMLNSTGQWADNHVGVTCNGETEQDRKAIGNEDFYYEVGKQEFPITYDPIKGFPAWFYPKKNQFYKTPAVMVHFNTIRTHHLVTIKCVAWAKSFNNGKPQNTDIYSTRFQIYME